MEKEGIKMKAHTDLEQSKKLAEILPLKSADMVLLHEEPYETSDSKFDGLHQALCVPFSQYDKSWRQKYWNISYFPCWSLAVLLEQIPSDLGSQTLTIEKDDSEHLKYGLNYHDRWGREDDIQTKYYDNLVDACYEMILKLHKQKFL